MNIWNKLPKPFLILAPMEGVTDVVFRAVIEHAGAGFILAAVAL